MEASTRTLILALVVVAAAAVVKADDDGTICRLTQAELMACKPAAATGAAVPPPPPKTGPCCTALKHANLTCFCEFRDSVYLPLLGINATRAMQLPYLCDSTKPQHC